MNVSRNVVEIIRPHVTLEVEGIGRMYLNLYAPRLQHDLGVLGFFRERGQAVASPQVGIGNGDRRSRGERWDRSMSVYAQTGSCRFTPGDRNPY